MRIAIATQPLSENYGGILQNFALQTVLLRMGHDPVTIDFLPWYTANWWRTTLSRFLKQWVLRLRFVPLPESKLGRARRTRGMRRFAHAHMALTPTVTRYTARVFRRTGAEMLLVGSDQVWNPIYYGEYFTDMFGAFVESEPNITLVAYAASMGHARWPAGKEQTRRIRELIKRFKAVSLREESGVEICRDVLGRKDARWVLDPTMLLTRRDYETLAEDVPRREPFLLAYILDDAPEKRALAERVARHRGLKLRYVEAGASIRPDDCPEKWLADFRDAGFVLTDSFHGTVFSLIFGVDFLTLRNIGRGNARFDSLIKIFGIEDRILSDPAAPFNLEKSLDWAEIAKRMKAWQVRSMNFLREALA